jgi:phenylalanyl-tRNA synthetase beta chain
MKAPLSWIKEYVHITGSPEEIAAALTYAGLEVEAIEYIGLAPQDGWINGGTAAEGKGPKAKGLAWDPDKVVVAEVQEVLPHPNADRLVLCQLNDGQQTHTVLTGAPNLFPFKGKGPLPRPLKVAYAKEGATLYDGHQPGQVLATLKRMKIRGVESYSMICSEKELGISEEHDGVILFPEDAPTGAPLAEYLGDVIFTVKINPNMARDANMLGVAREIAALTGQKLKPPSCKTQAKGPAMKKLLSIQIERPELNPRFSAVLIRDVKLGPSPDWMQRRLLRAGMRPINNIVDITNYVMLEIGQPLHAFDWDALAARAGGPVTIITRTANACEHLTTLDGVERELDEFTILVCDTKGPLSIAGVMGGAESEVRETTTNILLEAAAWDFISIRRVVQAQKLPSEAAFRFSRGVHPAMTMRGLNRAADLMRTLAGGTISRDTVDTYPRKATPVRVDLPLREVRRLLGVSIPLRTIIKILESLEFVCESKPTAAHGKKSGKGSEEDITLRVTAPDHRLDIGTGEIGQADLIEEIARVYGYAKIPERQMEDMLPSQRGNPSLEQEEAARDLLVDVGLQEVLTYHLTSPEREALLWPHHIVLPDISYTQVANPIVPDRRVMRRSLLAAVTEIAARNLANRSRVALFELGPVYLPSEGLLPAEPVKLAILMSGPRESQSWNPSDGAPMDFFDLKGVMEEFVSGLHLSDITYDPAEDPRFHPGRCAAICVSGQPVGVFGELHPQTATNLQLEGRTILAAEIEFEKLRPHLNRRHTIHAIPSFPPVLEDLAVIIADEVPVRTVLDAISRAGGELLANVRLFDVYRGEQIGAGKKSLAFSLAYQAGDRTLTSTEATTIRERIMQALEKELGGKVRRN